MRSVLGSLAAVLLCGPALAGEGFIRAAAGARVLPEQYVVVLEDEPGLSVREVAADLVAVYGGRVTYLYEAALRGFAINIPAEGAERMSADARVLFVEQDSEVWPATTQTNPTWGLDRIDEHDLPLSGTYSYKTLANSVHVYVIDSGIRKTHAEFGSRVSWGANFVNDGQGVDDCYGHGTHVAGIIGGSIHGVAKGVVLHPVRVFGCSGGASASAIIGAVNFVTINQVVPGVVNMSLGGGASSALDAAVQKSIASGLTYVASAGNSAANACNTSPARAPNVITVGATTSVDARSSFSNFGTCVDLFAPGSSITSPWASSDTALNTLSGTSASSAHVAGAAALYLAAHPQASAAAVRNALVNGATANVITNPGTGSPNRLLFTLVP